MKSCAHATKILACAMDFNRVFRRAKESARRARVERENELRAR